MRVLALDNTLACCGAADALAIARELDALGIHYLDAGCPLMRLGEGAPARLPVAADSFWAV